MWGHRPDQSKKEDDPSGMTIVSITVLKYSTLVEFQVLWTKRVLGTNKIVRTKIFFQTSHRVTLGPWLVRSFIQTETN